MGRFFLLHVDFHIWPIKFIIWLAATLACDYSGYGTQGVILYATWEQRRITAAVT